MLATGGARADEIHLTSDRIVVVNQAAARWAGRDLGTVVTLRDHTELRALVSELQTIRGVADSLGAQAHEAANQLHTVISLIELRRADGALEFATTQLTVAQSLTDAVLGAIAVPELAALVVGKAAQAGERGVELSLAGDSVVPAGIDPQDLVTIIGNLLDNAIDAAFDAPPPHRVQLGARATDSEVVLRVERHRPGSRPRRRRAGFHPGLEHQAARRPGTRDRTRVGPPGRAPRRRPRGDRAGGDPAR